jgi:serine protease inhibitor
VRIYEAGTTAAAATAVLMAEGTSIIPVEEITKFHAMRQFFFYILHKPTNNIYIEIKWRKFF